MWDGREEGKMASAELRQPVGPRAGMEGGGGEGWRPEQMRKAFTGHSKCLGFALNYTKNQVRVLER